MGIVEAKHLGGCDGSMRGVLGVKLTPRAALVFITAAVVSAILTSYMFDSGTWHFFGQ
jgi:hypothetical protein